MLRDYSLLGPSAKDAEKKDWLLQSGIIVISREKT